jgi:chemotaxis protein CheD
MELPHERSFYLEPGYICCSPAQPTLHTVVGSCVSVCLWDRELKYGAMNHFLYPATTDPEKATPTYGNVATTELVRMMLDSGSKIENLIAQILGGASPDPGASNPVGPRNVESARRALRRHGITIGSEDTGGVMGRKVVFDTRTGHVMTLKVHQIRQEDWLHHEPETPDAGSVD